MDIILKMFDNYILTPYIYSENLKEISFTRQFLSLFFMISLGGYIFYFITAGFNYLIIFDKRLLQHSLFLKNQVLKEIQVSCISIPFMGFLEACCFILEVRGYSKLYDIPIIHSTYYDWLIVLFSLITFIIFNDFCIYWIHRGLHSPILYKTLHKTHHHWKITTPFASHAFHPIDGFIETFPIHLYIYLFPMYKYGFLFMFLFTNIWSVSIHGGYFHVPFLLKHLINGSAHHTDHHLYYNYNYGFFLTLWDRIGSSYREPSAFNGNRPLDQLLKKK